MPTVNRGGAPFITGTTQTGAAAQPAPRTPQAPPAGPANTYQPPQGQGAVAGVNGTVPNAPPPPLTGTPFSEGYSRGTIFDAQAYLADRLKITGNGALRVFHHSDKEWGIPGVKTKITMRKNNGANGQVYGAGFYTSTKPERGYGQYEFQVELPLKAFEGKKIYESSSGGNTMPPGVDILAVRQGDRTWFIFKPESEYWLNRSATEADFDKPGEAIGWS